MQESDWTTSSWTKAQLDGRSVDFVLANGVAGRERRGRFSVRQDAAGRLQITVVTTSQGVNPAQFISTRRFLTQAMVDTIQQNTRADVAEFTITISTP